MNNNPSQNNPTGNNTHGLNFNGSTNELNNYSNTLPPMTSQNTHHLNFYGHEDDTNNNIFPGNQPTMASNNDNVHYHQQHTPNNALTSQ